MARYGILETSDGMLGFEFREVKFNIIAFVEDMNNREYPRIK
jgi:hypothetical protein